MKGRRRKVEVRNFIYQDCNLRLRQVKKGAMVCLLAVGQQGWAISKKKPACIYHGMYLLGLIGAYKALARKIPVRHLI